MVEPPRLRRNRHRRDAGLIGKDDRGTTLHLREHDALAGVQQAAVLGLILRQLILQALHIVGAFVALRRGRQRARWGQVQARFNREFAPLLEAHPSPVGGAPR